MLISKREGEGKKEKEGREGRRRKRRARERKTGRKGRRKEGRRYSPAQREGGFWPHTAHSSPSSLAQYMRCIYFLQTRVETLLAG